MTEKEIRAIIQSVCADLDRRVRQAVRHSVRKVVLPAALGAGLVLSPTGCGDEREVPVGDGAALVDGGADADPGAQMDYMAPDPDGAVQPPYMAPGPDAGVDFGPVQPPYMAPGPDAGVAPDARIDPDPFLDYMAPGPDGSI